MELLRTVALSYLNVRYRYGGQSPLSGMDCSGLVIEILRSVGMQPPRDMTAQDLYYHFSKKRRRVPDAQGFGALAFFGRKYDHISHVGFCMDEMRMLEASGGNRHTLTLEDAAIKDARVKIGMIDHRADLIEIIMPKYRLETQH